MHLPTVFRSRAVARLTGGLLAVTTLVIGTATMGYGQSVPLSFYGCLSSAGQFESAVQTRKLTHHQIRMMPQIQRSTFHSRRDRDSRRLRGFRPK